MSDEGTFSNIFGVLNWLWEMGTKGKVDEK